MTNKAAFLCGISLIALVVCQPMLAILLGMWLFDVFMCANTLKTKGKAN